jgi:hypothetical protein
MNIGRQSLYNTFGALRLRRFRHCYEGLFKRLGQFPERFGVRIHTYGIPTYVLMPNHYHLQLELGARLSSLRRCIGLTPATGPGLTGDGILNLLRH